MTGQLKAVLARLDAWPEANAPADYAALGPPAAQDDTDAVSDRRFPLHPDLAGWLGRHDGVTATRGHDGPGVIIPGGFILHGAEGMSAGQRSLNGSTRTSRKRRTTERAALPKGCRPFLCLVRQAEAVAGIEPA